MAYKPQTAKPTTNEPDYVLLGYQCPKCGVVHEVRVPRDWKSRRNFVMNSVCPGVPGLKCGHSGAFGIKYEKDPSSGQFR